MQQLSAFFTSEDKKSSQLILIKSALNSSTLPLTVDQKVEIMDLLLESKTPYTKEQIEIYIKHFSDIEAKKYNVNIIDKKLA